MTSTTVAWPADVDKATGPLDRRRGNGRWEITDGGDDGFDVSLSFHDINDYEVGPGSHGSGFDISGSREDLRLYAWFGDPDDCANMSTFSSDSPALTASWSTTHPGQRPADPEVPSTSGEPGDR